ncbi:MAG: hypothetical protein ABFD94_15095 [Armatimonadia bacterium]
MTRADIVRKFRSLLNDLGGANIPSTSATVYSAADLATEALRDYAKETLSFPVTYSRAAVTNDPYIAYSSLGVVAADPDLVSVSVSAANATDFVLVAGQPAVTGASRFHISITLTNGNGAPSTGNAASYTVRGTGRGGASLFEVVAFTSTELTNIAAGAAVTKSTLSLFQTVTSITCPTAQPAGWTHQAGVAVDTPGARILEVDAVAFDEVPVLKATRNDLDEMDPRWRTRTSGTVQWWIYEGAGMLRLHYPPSSTDTLRIDAFEVPDPLLFSIDTQEPPIDAADHELLALRMALIAAFKTEDERRQASLYPEWLLGTQNRRKLLHAPGKAPAQFGQNQGGPRRLSMLGPIVPYPGT